MKNESFVGREEGSPFVARDGALIFELFKKNRLFVPQKLSIAVGYLKPRQRALLHYHQISEEIYYILSGSGKVRIGNNEEEIRDGDAIFVPLNAVHALTNASHTLDMHILAVCSPPYKNDDIFFIE